MIFLGKQDLPEFKRFNLIYGWNRSGKTTISRVFSSCEKRCVYDKDKFKQYPENGEFEIKTSDDVTIKNTDVATGTLPVKVFNQDFIDDNISFNPSNSCNPIVYISEEDIEGKKQLEKLGADRIIFGKNYEDAKKNKVAKEEVKTVFLKGLGVTISNVIFDKAYNRTKAENKISKIGIDNFADKVLSDEDKDKYEEISKSRAGEEMISFPKFQMNFVFEEEEVDTFEKLFIAIQNLLSKKVVSETLGRLKDDPDLNNWVKQGFDLYKIKQEKEKCLFCEKSLNNEFLDSLSKHFSQDYEDLQRVVVELQSEVIKLKKEKIAINNDDFYPDLKKSYASQVEALNEVIERLNSWLDIVILKLNEKYANPLIIITNPEKPGSFLTDFNRIIDELNKLITSHNGKVKNHETEVRKAREKLELHSIAVAVLEQDYKKFESDLVKANTEEKEALQAVNKNNADISELEKKTLNIGKAVEKINRHLKEFFDKEEIKLELDAEKKGYIIKRDGQLAKNLSEGEKTAIAFSYFIVKTEEKEFKIKEGIIFIDDPISSLDSNFTYHCFSLITTHFKEVGQLIISTHNFQLFNLVKDWLTSKNDEVKKDNRKLIHKGVVEKPLPCEFFMVENFLEADNKRKARLVELDKTLLDYKSEYHFLFAKLKEFLEKQDAGYEDFYTIGNMARRFFDIFTDFKIPKTGDQKSRIDILIKNINADGEKIGIADVAKAYKLVNEFSHNSDPTSAIEHKDKGESKNAIRILLNIVKESDPKHYEFLEKSLE